jgi:hypothetical protein
MGVFPNLFLDKVRPSIEYLSANYKNYRLVADTCDSHTRGSNAQCVRPSVQANAGQPNIKQPVALESPDLGASGVLP